MNGKMIPKIFSVLMCLAVLLSCFPLSALAAETNVTISIEAGGYSGDLQGTAWKTEQSDGYITLTLNQGYRFTINGKCTCKVINNGTIVAGEFHGLIENSGTIVGGTYNGYLRNYGTISGGVFSASVANYGLISGGSFENNVVNGNEAHFCFSEYETTYKLGTTGHIAIETCKDCPLNASRNLAEAAHSVGTEADLAATCTAQAYCSVCKLSYGETAAHSWDNGVCEGCTASCEHEWDNGICEICKIECSHTEKKYSPMENGLNHWQVCTECDMTFGDPVSHSGGTATCKEPAVCIDCHTHYGETDSTNHASAEVKYSKIDYAQHEKQRVCCSESLETLPHNFGDDAMCDDCKWTANVLLTHGETVYGYASFADALVQAQTLENSVIKLFNYSESLNEAYSIAKGKFTIDLNGCTLKANVNYVNTFEIKGGDVTVIDSSESGTGKIKPGNYAVKMSGGTLRLCGGTIEAGQAYTDPFGVHVFRASLYIDGGSAQSVCVEGGRSNVWIAGDDIDGVTKTVICLTNHIDDGEPVIRIAEKLSGDDTYSVYIKTGYVISAPGVIAQGEDYTITTEDAARFKANHSYSTVMHNTADNTLELKKKLTAELSTIETTYSGAEQKPELSVNAENENTDYTVTYLRDGKVTTDFTSAGTITIEVNGMGDYAGKHTFTYTIKPAKVKITAAEFEDKVYDGTKTLTVKAVTGSGGISSDDVSVDFSKATAAVSDANAGPYDTVTIGGLELTGAAAGNYSITQPVELKMDVTIAKAKARELSAALTIRNDMARTYKVDMSKFAPKDPMVWGNEQYEAELTIQEEAYEKITATIKDGQLIVTVPKVTSDLTDTVGNVKIVVTSDNFAQSEITVRLVSKEPVEYKITKGNGAKWYQSSKKDLSFTANGAYSKFTSVEVDGKTLDKADYDVASGSTVLTLENAYLKDLKTGSHTIKIWYTDGVASGTFNVRPASEIPETGDSNEVFLWGGALALSCVGLAVGAMIFRRKNKQ